VGLRPSYGRVSRFGLAAFASSLDQIGPIAHTVRDCAILLGAVAGYDPRDSTSVPTPAPDFWSAAESRVRGLRIGVADELSEGCSPEVASATTKAIELLESMGCTVERISLSNIPRAVAAYHVISAAEASSNLARYDGVRYGLRTGDGQGLESMYCGTRTSGFGAEVKRRILLGTYALSAGYRENFYARAQKVRRMISRDFAVAFRKVDLIAGPVAPSAAFRLGEKVADPLSMYLSDAFTIPSSLAGLPGISVPCGFTAGRLPVGLQLVGRPFDEETVIRAAHAYEQAACWEMTPDGI
jgi:aspartyl-tRNA(Asn)/glutamyl-tRNA(Gln) amidotransferase subunit A